MPLGPGQLEETGYFSRWGCEHKLFLSWEKRVKRERRADLVGGRSVERDDYSFWAY